MGVPPLERALFIMGDAAMRSNRRKDESRTIFAIRRFRMRGYKRREDKAFSARTSEMGSARASSGQRGNPQTGQR